MILAYAVILFEPLIEIITETGKVETASLYYYLFFIPNFQLVLHDAYPLNNCLTVLWSVGVEEQFYLFWPLLFFFRKLRLWVMVAIIAGSIYFRYLNFEDFKTIAYHTFSVMGVLGIGCLLGYFCFAKKFLQSSIFIPKLVNFGIYVFGLTTIFLYPIFFISSLGIAFFTTLSGLFFAYIIFEQVFVKNPLFNLGSVKFLNYWGKHTYGLYCLHPIGILISFNITKIIKLEESIYWELYWRKYNKSIVINDNSLVKLSCC